MDRNVKQLEYVSPEIKYKNGPMDTFVHVDFIHRSLRGITSSVTLKSLPVRFSGMFQRIWSPTFSFETLRIGQQNPFVSMISRVRWYR